MKKYTIALLSLLTTVVLFSSCKKEYESIETVDEAAIQAYINANNLKGKMTRDSLGVYYQVLDAGSGDVILNRDSVLFTYQEKSITDATIYYSTSVNGNEGTYYGYMSGRFNDSWKTALKGLKFGGKVRLLIPSRLAYGKNGSASLNIPSNAIIDTYITTSTYRKQWQWDDAKIQTYLTSKGLTATKDASRVYYITSAAGTGTDIINDASTVVIKYTGRLLDGTVFDSSTDGTYSTTLSSSSGLIQGWTKLIPKFTAGAKFRMFIPSDLAYGPNGSVNPNTGVMVIPPNAILDFDIEIVSVTN